MLGVLAANIVAVMASGNGAGPGAQHLVEVRIQAVVAVTDEAGGWGAQTAAPMARMILAKLFQVGERQLVAGGGSSD